MYLGEWYVYLKNEMYFFKLKEWWEQVREDIFLVISKLLIKQ